MTESLMTQQHEFEAFCKSIREAGIVGFDTEFISEFTWRPELCLLQLATTERAVLVDPFEVRDLSPWWEIMLDPDVVVVAHGGREEARFCVTNTGQAPVNFKDVQIAEGFRGRSFPLGYDALVKRVLGHKSHGKETRSDWRRRPLTKSQIHYAIEDVQHILPIWAKQAADLKKKNRLEWVEDEFSRLIRDVMLERADEAWLKLPGLHKLNSRELAVAKNVFWWREHEAEARDKPSRRILRDDLVIELARRQPANIDELIATRDMNRTEYRKAAAEILAAIDTALALPEDELPSRPPEPEDDQSHDEQLLGQLLGIALANRCAEMNVAMSIVGKTADLRHLVRWHVFGDKRHGTPRLMQGWRAEVCGDLLSNVLDGKISLRVADPQSDHPLVFEYRSDEGVVEKTSRLGPTKRPVRSSRRKPKSS